MLWLLIRGWKIQEPNRTPPAPGALDKWNKTALYGYGVLAYVPVETLGPLGV
jgi:hypothetical protein